MKSHIFYAPLMRWSVWGVLCFLFTPGADAAEAKATLSVLAFSFLLYSLVLLLLGFLLGKWLDWPIPFRKVDFSSLLQQSAGQDLEQAFYSALDAFWEWDLEEDSFSISETWAQSLGLVGDQRLWRREAWCARIHDSDFAAVQAAQARYLSGESEAYQLEYRIRQASGDFLWIAESARIVARDAQGRPCRLVGAHENIHLRKSIDLALRKSEATLEAVFRMAPIGIALIQDRRLTWSNKQLSDLTGYTPGELLGLSTQCFYESEAEFERVGEAIYPEVQARGLASCESRWRHKHGPFKDVHLHVSSIGAPGAHHESVITVADATEWKQTERALRESRQRYRQLVELSPAAIMVLREWELIYVNSAGLKLVGARTLDEMVGKDVRSFIHESDRKDLLRQWHSLSAGDHERATVEKRGLRLDGSTFYAEASGMPIHFHGMPATLLLVQDISQRKRHEAALYDHLAFQSVLGSLRNIAPEESVEVFIQVFLEELVEQFGFPLAWYGDNRSGALQAQAVAANSTRHQVALEKKIAACALNHGQCLIAKAIKSRQAQECSDFKQTTCVCALQDHAKSLASRSYLALPFFVDTAIAGGIVVYAQTEEAFQEERTARLKLLVLELASLIRDAHVRRAAEEDRKLLVTAIEHAAESIVVTDCDGVIQYVNPAFELRSGYSRDEAVGKTPRILKSGKHSRGFYQGMWRALKSGQVWRGQITNSRQDGALYENEAAIAPVWDKEKEISHFVAVSRDTTHELNLERRLLHAQKMEAIGTLAGGIAHDFNNILSAIIGFSELAFFDLPQESEARSSIEEVLRAARRAADLVKQILSFSRQGVQGRESVYFQEVLKEVLALLRGMLPATIEIQQQIQEDCGPIFANATELHQIVMNLCTNAFHAMEEGGVLTVNLAEEELDAATTASMNTLQPGRYVCLSIYDTGCGMDERVLRRLFEPYFTTKEAGKGTGLGLATSHGIVSNLGGEIQVDSVLGKGSVFRVYLPRCAPPDEFGQGQSAETSQGRKADRAPRVLFVDDEAALARLGLRYLQRQGYQVEACTDSRNAFELFQAQPHHFDILITDQIMPGMTGLELARNVLQIRENIPIILCSGYSERITEAELSRSGVRRYLRKPITDAALVKAIRGVLQDAAGRGN